MVGRHEDDPPRSSAELDLTACEEETTARTADTFSSAARFAGMCICIVERAVHHAADDPEECGVELFTTALALVEVGGR